MRFVILFFFCLSSLVFSKDTNKVPIQTIVFLGDSLTAGLGLPTQELAFPNLLENRFNKEGLNIKILNAGQSGDTTSGGLERLSWVLEENLDVFVLELGANDMMRGVKVPTIKANLKQIIQKVKLRFPNAKILVLGLYAFPNLGKSYRKEFDRIYKDIAAEEKVALVPFFIERVAGIKSLNQKDGIHPTEEGHRLIANTVYPHLKKFLSAPKPTKR